MSAPVASKNPYDVLGNDLPEDDTPTKAPKLVVKNTTSTKKQEEKPVRDTAAGGNRGGNRNKYTGNEQAFRDRGAGRENNRSKDTDQQGGLRERGDRGGRGGRGRGGRREYDRHSGSGRDEHEKQVAHGWGATEGNSEWNDEIAGQELAQKDAAGADPADPNASTDAADENAAPAEEEEEVAKTYDDYLAELAQRQANLGPRTDVRRPNEGSREDKKWANAKALDKADEEYFAGEDRDKTRTRQRKQKNLLDIEPRFVEPRENRRGGDRGGRGGRGDRGGRGGRGGGGDRPRGDRGDYGNRGGHRGGRNQSTNVNTNDSSAFPPLGA